MRALATLACLLLATGCVVDEQSASDEPEGGADLGGDQGTSGDGSIDPGRDGGPAPDGGRPPRDGGPPVDGGPDDGSPPRDATPEDMRPPQPPPGNPCDQTCARMYECFDAECAALADADFLPDFCEGLCDAPPQFQNNLNRLACGDYIEALGEFIPELPLWCSDEPPPDECVEVCGFLATCGAEIEVASCQTFCRAFEPEQLECLLDSTASMNCGQAFGCFGDEPEEPEEDFEENCAQICEREFTCVRNECAPGTQAPGAGQACFERCLGDPPTAAEVRANAQRRCAEIVGELRADPDFDRRCSADEEDACAQLCADTIGDCMDPAECAAACPGWNETNLTCLRFSGGQCGVVRTCIDSPEAQPLCERACARWAECLEEACPPRILPPTLGEGCAVGCLFDPPAEDEVEAYEDLACPDVRELIYEESPELAPICEGDPEFNPTPAECVGFCERGLEACIGIGGRDFCLGACATLDRDEYECALAAGEDCMAINACFAE